MGEIVLECLADFWKKHKKTWDCDKMLFTVEQQEMISESVNPYNYFA